MIMKKHIVTLFTLVMFTIPVLASAQLVTCTNSCDFDDFVTSTQNVINFLIFSVATPLAAIMFAYAGWLYLSARGNQTQLQRAHDIFWYVLWGLLVALCAWIIVKLIIGFLLDPAFGGSLLT